MSSILPHKVEQIEVPFVVACEGFGDVCLVEQLLKLRNIGNCRVGCPSRAGTGGDGRDYIGKYLSAIRLASNKTSNGSLHGLLVIVDADDSPEQAFGLACSALLYAEYPVPDSAFTLKEENGIKTSVFLIPGKDETGTLEHLLLRAAFEATSESQLCTASFLNCIGKSPAEDSNVLAKMQMSALVAASFPENPWATPGPLLQSSKNNLIPINSPHFSSLADYLAEFCKE
jgi:hypothetical protein